MKYIFFIFLVGFIFFSCSEKGKELKTSGIHIFSSAEEVANNKFVTQTESLTGGEHQSDEHSKSGKYSLKLSKNNPYGFGYNVIKVKKGDVIKVAVWKKSSSDFGSIVIDVVGEDDFDLRNFLVIKKEGEWGLIDTYFFAEKDYEQIKIFAYNPEEEAVYFDDLSIDIYKNTRKPKNIEDALVINIPKLTLDSISACRDTALMQGVLTSNLKRYFKSEIIYNGDTIPVKLRLKGDWTDHLKSNKWSYRIKVRGNHSFEGLKSFSIQNPSTRGFMLEWFAHKLYEREDILTTTYKFIPVIINGENMGVYALEEHFDKQLLESRNRREAPIVKFDEGGVWQSHLYRMENFVHFNRPVLEAADIMPFKKKRTYRTPSLNKQFQLAAQKMNQYRSQKDNLEDCFNEDAIAKYLALTDLINGKHSLIWHNQRFYFNPVMNRLEPIAYDCFTSLSELEYNPRLIGSVRFKKGNLFLSEYILTNPSIEKKYFEYLNKFIAGDYLENAIKDLEEEISKNVELLKNEYPFVHFNMDFFKSNQTNLSYQLKEYSKEREKEYKTEIKKEVFDKLPDNVLFTKISLSVFTVEKDSLHAKLSVKNYHSSPIQIVGYLTKGQNISDYTPLNHPIHLIEYDGSVDFREFTINDRPKSLVFKADNCGDSLFSKKINKWPVPKKLLPIKYTFTDDTIVFSKGEYHFSTDVIIPKGRKVFFEKGVSMNFTKSAGFISYSPVEMTGTELEPIQIYSSDSTASGFTIIASHQKVKMSYCFFNGFSSMNKNNWILTGAVTIYEGLVEINNCQFENNHCEDALNIIRSRFEMNHCLVSNTTSDGFDADFCTGTVNNSVFKNTGNDCVDFSGSTISVIDCRISESGDKGISGGEKSSLKIENCLISNASIGIASKDMSTVEVNDVTLKNCDYAFAAYRKKPEFGPASIVVYSMKGNDSRHLYLLEKDSKLKYINKEYVGDKIFNIDSMYVQFKK